MTSTALSRDLGFLAGFIARSGWETDRSQLREALPHLSADLNAEDHIATLRNLGLPVAVVQGRLSDLTAHDLPCLFIDGQGDIALLTDRAGNRVRVETATAGEGTWRPATRARGLFVRLDHVSAASKPSEVGSVIDLVAQFRGTVAALLFASFFTNLMALFVPLLILVLYDRAIPAGALDFVGALALAMIFVFGTDTALRMIRARAVAHMGAHVEGRLARALFRKLAVLSLSEIRKSDVEQQIARLKQFESMRDLFAGPVFTAVLDLPFIVLFIAVLFWLSPAIGAVVMVAVVIFGLLAAICVPVQARRGETAATARAAHQRLFLETVRSQRALARFGIVDHWTARHEAAAAESAVATRKARTAQVASQAVGQGVMAVSGVGAVFLATHMAMSGALGFGALIAVMTLVWKTLAPVHALVGNTPQLAALVRSRRQIDRVLSLRGEFRRGSGLRDVKAFDGRVSVVNVSHRFAGAHEAALTQVGLEVEAGERVVICGPAGAGKSALLDLMDGLHVPLAGALRLDGVDFRQIAVDDLRRAVSTARPESAFFHGTIIQNFQLACPALSEDDVADAVAAMDLGGIVAGLPEGLQTRLTEAVRQTLPGATLKGLSLARCLARPAAVYLLDNPGAELDPPRRRALDAWLDALAGRATVIVASNDAGFVATADRIVFLDDGHVVMTDTGSAGRRKALALIARASGRGTP